jgi:hypothetical protein
MSRTRLIAGLAATASLVVATGLVAPASVDAATAAAGPPRTRVAVAPKVVKLLTAAHISAAPIGDAKAFAFRGTVAFRFPVTGTNPAGTKIRHSGGVRLSSDHDSIALRRFRIDLGAGSVSAIVNRTSRVDVFTLGMHPNPDLGDVRLKLTGPAARALNQTFGVHAFKKGGTFGFAAVKGL